MDYHLVTLRTDLKLLYSKKILGKHQFFFLYAPHCLFLGKQKLSRVFFTCFYKFTLSRFELTGNDHVRHKMGEAFFFVYTITCVNK